MAQLVTYSGTESDDSNEEDVRDIRKSNQHIRTSDAPQRQAELDVNKPVTASTCTTANDATFCAAATNDQSHEVDFFSLLVDSSSDSGEDTTTPYFVKGNNVWSKPISKKTHYVSKKGELAKSKLDALSKQDNHNDHMQLVQCEIPYTSHHKPESVFWSEYGKPEDWDKPEQIWKKPSNCEKQLLDKNTLAPQSQREYNLHKKEVVNRKSEARKETVALAKSCFYIHHKIHPALHQTLPCQSPTHKYVSLPGHVGAVNRVKWAKADFSHILASASMDNTVKIWNIFSSLSYCVQTFCFHTKAVKDITWSPSGNQILSCGYDRTARLNDVAKGAEIVKFEHQAFLTCVKYHPINPNYILLGSKDSVLCYDVRCPKTCVKTFGYKHNFGQVQDLVFIRDGHEFVISTDLVSRDSADRNIMVFDFGSGVVLSNQVYQERYMCPRLAVHPHQPEMMAQSGGNYLSLFSIIKPYKMNRCKRFEGHMVLGYAVGCGYSRDGRLVVSGSSDSKILIWDHQRAVRLGQLGDPGEVYLDVAWHPVLSSTVASSTWSGLIDVWQ